MELGLVFGTTGSSDLVSGLKLDLEVVLYFQIWWGVFLSNVLFDCTPKKKSSVLKT